jgi:hypothetical protein
VDLASLEADLLGRLIERSAAPRTTGRAMANDRLGLIHEAKRRAGVAGLSARFVLGGFLAQALLVVLVVLGLLARASLEGGLWLL